MFLYLGELDLHHLGVAVLLLLVGHSQVVGDLEEEEEQGGPAEGPCHDADDADQLHAELLASAERVGTVGAAVVAGDAGEVVRAEDADGEGTPDAARAVHREGVDNVIDLELGHHLGGTEVHEGRHDTDDHGTPHLDDVGRGGDAHKTSDHTVAQDGDVVGAGDDLNEQHSQGGERSGQSGQSGDLGRDSTGKAEHRLRGDDVESVVADPDEESADHKEGYTVLLKGGVGVKTTLIEAMKKWGTLDKYNDAKIILTTVTFLAPRAIAPTRAATPPTA